MGDRKPVTLIPELNSLEKDSHTEENSVLPMANRVESDMLMNCREGNEDKLAEENPSFSHTMDESDYSDDVNVCDICGDEGREDELAICCRCADGAEHIYCMRDLLEEVPEGDWMCEECQNEEEMKNQRQRKVVNVDGNGRTSSGKASGGNSNSKSGNDLEISSKDCSNMEILGKRPKEDVEVSSLSKRRAVELVIGSPKTSGSNIVASLSQDMSLRNLDKGKEKLAYQSSSSTPVGSNNSKLSIALVTRPRRLTPRFNISNSFNSLNENPKVKLEDEDVPLKQKSVREPPEPDIKEGNVKSYGKSMSCCPVDVRPDVSDSKNVRGLTNGSTDLKAAIEAAMLRKPGIFRKPRVADHSKDSSQASKNGDIVSDGHFLGPVSKKNMYSGLAKNEVSALRNSTNSCKDNVETSASKTGDEALVVTFDGKSSIRDSSFQPPSPLSVIWKTMAIPEHEFTWQGNFEVRKNEKVEYCDGLQAHISASASPRVIGVVNKFHKKVILNEAPRSSTWPLQFQEYGVKEDNVALYFFAKDVDSYEKSYKTLLESMISKDLALKGTIEGVELLIFPSTQLLQQSQRWNMLHFLWGVFIGKKTSQSYEVCSFPGQQDKLDNGPATMSLPENICSLEPVEKTLASKATLLAETTASKDGFDVSGVTSSVQVKVTDKINVDTQGVTLGSNALTSQLSNSVKEEGADLKCNSEAGDVQASVQASLD